MEILVLVVIHQVGDSKMPNFTQNLASNPSSGIYGSIAPSQPPDVLNLFNKVRDRDLNDFYKKADFMSNLSLKQDRLKRIYDQQDNQTQPMNTVLGRDPNTMSPYEKGELSIRQQQIGQEGQRLAQQGKLGQEALDIKQQQEKLNQQKSDQIHEQKMADMQRKIDESNQRIQLAQQALQQKTDNAEAQLAAHKELAAAMEERHKLELAQKQAQFDKTSAQHQQTIDALNKRLQQQSRTRTTTQINPEGTERTTTTERGNAIGAPVKNPDGTYTVTAPDGSKGIIPADKLDDWMKNHHPGSQEDQNQDNQNENDQNNDEGEE